MVAVKSRMRERSGKIFFITLVFLLIQCRGLQKICERGSVYAKKCVVGVLAYGGVWDMV